MTPRTTTTKVLDALHTDRFIDAGAVQRRARVRGEAWTRALGVLTRLRLIEVVHITAGQRGTRRLAERVYRRVAA